MIPAIFTVGEAVSHEATDLNFTKAKDKERVDCSIRGIPFRGVEATDDHEKYAFVIRNKTTGKLKVIARQPLLFRPFKEDKEPATVNKPLERTALVEAFGSGKKLRTMRERQEREAVAGSAREVEAVVSAVSKEASNRNSTSADERGSGAMLPPLLNAEALEPAQVYDIEALLPGAVQMALKEEAEALAASSAAQRLAWQEENTYPEVVLSRLQFLPSNSEARATMAEQLVFLRYMLRLSKTSAATLRSAAPLKDVPHAVSQFLLRSFTLLAETPTRKVRCCPNWMKEKQMYHILVLILHIDNYKTDMQGLTAQLKMSINRLTKFFQALGCKIQHDKAADKKFAILKTPVIFPEQRFKK